MKYLVGLGLGKTPVYDKDAGTVTLHPPFGKIELEDILYIMNINENKILHMSNNEGLSLTESDITYNGENCVIAVEANVGSNTDEIHVWVSKADGRAYNNDISEAYLTSLNIATTRNLKFENSGSLTLDFQGSETTIENAILNMDASIQTMTAAINELAAVPDTQLLQNAGTYALTDAGWSSYSQVVSIRAITGATFILKEGGVEVVNGGASVPFNLAAGDYLDIKFDEIVLSTGKVIVTFLA